MNQLSLQIRLVYSFIIIALISIILVGLLSLGITMRIFNKWERRTLNGIAREASKNLEDYYRKKQKGKLSDALNRFGLQNNVALKIEGPDGTLLAGSSALLEHSDLPLMPVARTTLDFQPLRGNILLVVRFDDYYFHPLSLLLEGVLLAGLGAVVAAIFMGRYSGRRLAKPIICLSRLASEISLRNWEGEMPQVNSRELQILADSLNNMRRQLASGFKALEEERDLMRRFLEDASHQLRTPVTALTTFLELLDSNHPDLKARQEEILTDCRGQVNKLSRIIRDLMELARIESGEIITQRDSPATGELCSLKVLCLKAWKGLEARGQAKGLVFDLKGEAPPVRGEPHLLEMAFSNILDNAIKWSPSRGRILVNLIPPPLNRKEGLASRDFVIVEIEDQGPGIQPEDMERIFERFYQSFKKDSEGSGLGLSIVKSILQKNRGYIRALSPASGGAKFEIRLPCADKVRGEYLY